MTIDLMTAQADQVFPRIVVSHGEFYDKLSILKLKSKYITHEAKLFCIHNELESLRRCEAYSPTFEQHELFINLLSINEFLWHSEDDVRNLMPSTSFLNCLYSGLSGTAGGSRQFIDLVIQNFAFNDKRHAAKACIDKYFGSLIREQKSYDYIGENV
jgi:hypothetical protein